MRKRKIEDLRFEPGPDPGIDDLLNAVPDPQVMELRLEQWLTDSDVVWQLADPPDDRHPVIELTEAELADYRDVTARCERWRYRLAQVWQQWESSRE